MRAEYGDVVPLVNTPAGWTEDQVEIFHNSNPVFGRDVQDKLRDASDWTLNNRTAEATGGRLKDTNGPKAGLEMIARSLGNYLNVSTIATDYFTLRGLQEVHYPKLHDEALDDLRRIGHTRIPFGISTHNVVLLSPYGSRNPDTASVVAIINSDDHGFAAGKLSLSYEGQLDPTKDLNSSTHVPSTFETVKRTLREEFGIVNPADIRLLAVCAEKQTQYTSWCHVIWVEGTPDRLLASYEKAPRRNDSKVLFSIPLSEIDAYAQDEIGPHIYARDIIRGSLAPGAILNPHPTVPWRVDALKDHLAATQ